MKTKIYLNDTKIIEVEKFIEFNLNDIAFVNGVKSVVISIDELLIDGDIETSVYFKPLFQLKETI